MSVEKLADRLCSAADVLTSVDRSVPQLAVPAGAFGADDAGAPGRIGRELHAHWDAVLAARAQEAAAVAVKLADMAQAVRTTSQRYAETDEAAAHRLEREYR